MRRLFYTLRILIWLPFYIGGHPAILVLGMTGAWLLASAPGGGKLDSFLAYAFLVALMNRAMFFASTQLFPGKLKLPPPKPAKPISSAMARPAGTVMKCPPAAHAIHYLPPALQAFLREEAMTSEGAHK